MLDIKKIRSNPNEFDQELKKRNIKPLSNRILELDTEKRKNIEMLEIQKASVNSLSKDFGKIKAFGSDEKIFKFKEKIKDKKISISKLENEVQLNSNKLTSILKTLPNLCGIDIPYGINENDNIKIYEWGNVKKFQFRGIGCYSAKIRPSYLSVG